MQNGLNSYLPTENKLLQYQKEPSLFIKDALDDNPRWSKQTEIIESVRDNRNTYVKSCHGVGKTFTAKDVVMWFLYCHVPSKIITTAPSWPQVEKLLWSEINNAHKNAKVNLGGACLNTAVKIDPEWFALGISPRIDTEDEGNRITGFHSENMLIIFDEGPAVNPKLWNIKETLMTSENVRFLAIGNPVVDSGHFFDGFSDESVNSINMLIFDSPNFIANKVTSKEDLQEIANLQFKDREQVLSKMENPFRQLTNVRWAVDRLLAWGMDSPIFQARVLGVFPEKTDDTVISYSSLEACKFIMPQIKHYKTLGVDVARFGVDSTCFIGYENGKQIYKDKWNGQDTVKTANKIKYLIKNFKYNIVVIDDTGLGGGVTDQVVEFVYDGKYKTRVIPVNFAESAINEEYDGIVTEMYFNTKSMLEDKEIQVVDDGQLFKELSNRKYKFTNKGKFKIESKDEFKKRTNLSSPDEGDAFILCMWGIRNMRYKPTFAVSGERETI
ncbi:MAG: hypothetical protein GY853_16140 [PVC group bacterium]|nr:hypothetical protein [PVC group bacterium]